MKKVFCFLLSVMFLCFAAAAAETWICPNCGKDTEGSFCGWCGAKNPKAMVICSNCGAETDPDIGYLYCINCGNKLQEPSSVSSTANRKLHLIVYGYADYGKLEDYLRSVSWESEITSILPDEYGGLASLTTRIYAQEADLLVIPRDVFLTLAADGFLMPLEEDQALSAGLDILDLLRWPDGWTQADTGEMHLYGISLDHLPGFSSYAFTDGGFFCIANNTLNPVTARYLFSTMCMEMRFSDEP